MCTWIRLLVLIYSFISSIFFLLNSKTLYFCHTFLWGHIKLKIDTHMGNGLIYCVHQIQAARIYLFLYFSSFFSVSPISNYKLASSKLFQNTPQPLYNAIVWVQANFRVSYPICVISKVKCWYPTQCYNVPCNKEVQVYLWWLWPGVCELCSLSIRATSRENLSSGFLTR